MKDKDENMTESCGPMGAMPMRQPVEELLRSNARSLRNRAHSMEILADEIERRRFSQEADELLWSLVCDGLRVSHRS